LHKGPAAPRRGFVVGIESLRNVRAIVGFSGQSGRVRKHSFFLFFFLVSLLMVCVAGASVLRRFARRSCVGGASTILVIVIFTDSYDCYACVGDALNHASIFEHIQIATHPWL
jgi:hypothetical protein